MLQVLAVGLGGFVGAIARYAISSFLQQKLGRGFPFGTLAVNTIGCLAIGVILGLVAERPSFSNSTRLFLVTGILGSLTTFSTFGYETVELFRKGETTAAAGNVAANVCLGVAAVVLGLLAVGLVPDR